MSEKQEARLLSLYEKWLGCQRCPKLCEGRANIVFGHGPATSPLVIIGEAPGEREDEEGVPFVGRAGQFLRELATEAQLDLDDAFVTNIVACRPPENRVPMPAEVDACRRRLHALLYLIRPKAVLLVGGTAAIAMAGVRYGITKNRGRWQVIEFEWKGEQIKIPALPTLHPSGVLRLKGKLHTAARKNLQADLAEVARCVGLGLPGDGFSAEIGMDAAEAEEDLPGEDDEQA